MTAKLDPLVLIIAGSDSCGAAGIQTDALTIHHHSCRAHQVITAITAQSFDHCFSVSPTPPEMIAQQILAADPSSVKAVKLGMIGSSENLAAIKRSLATVSAPIVFDPVILSTSGKNLAGNLSPKEMMSLAELGNTIITPNIPEAEMLTGQKLATTADTMQAAAALLEHGFQGVLIKGGHFFTSKKFDAHDQPFTLDYFADRAGIKFWLRSPRKAKNLRGTGCALASAIAGNLAAGYEVYDAVVRAKAYINQLYAHCLNVSDKLATAKHTPLRLASVDMPEVIPAAWDPYQEFAASPADKPGFYVIADSVAWIDRLSQLAVPSLQLRIKGAAPEILCKEIEAAVRITAARKSNLYINDSWAHAIAANAYGVHLGQEDLLTADLTAIKNAGLRLGISTHSWFEAGIAHHVKPSYIALGPVFPTTCKSMRFGPQGFNKVREWQHSWPYPTVAIGGLNLTHAPTLKAMMVEGVALISDVTRSEDPNGQVGKWLAALC